MMLAGTMKDSGGNELGGGRLRFLIAAFLLGVLVFSIDTFTTIESAIAVFYVLVLLLAADSLTRRGVVILAGICMFLTLFAFIYGHGWSVDYGHGWNDDISSFLRLVVSLAAIAITAGLIVRNHAVRELLVEMNAALTQSEKRYRSIFEQSLLALWEQDFSAIFRWMDELRAQGVTDFGAYARQHQGVGRESARLIHTVTANEATLELLGASSLGDIMGPVERFVSPDETVSVDLLQACFEGRDRFEGRAQIVTLSGRQLTVLIAARFPEAGSFERVIVGMVDITQREQTQQTLLALQTEVARASRAATVGVLSASIAHELNQPIGALVMNAQTCLRWLRREVPDIEAASKAAERMVRDGKRASEIVTNTRSMLTNGSRKFAILDLREMIEETRALLEHELAADRVIFRVDYASGVAPIEGSRTELQQVMINLITNGIQAMKENGTGAPEITVKVDSPDPEHVRVGVRDRGKGLNEDIIERLFDPFFTTKQNGMGMGLAICRQAIEARGGNLTARNHPEGGAVFEFVLPLEMEHA